MIALSVIGIPVAEHCNLNCKGCLHFCHKDQQPYLYNLDSFKSDIDRMKELFENIGTIRFYGGEPLLHSNLSMFIEYAYKKYPNSSLEILTNGLLITSIGDKLKIAIKQCNAKIVWSVYPIISEQRFYDTIDFLKTNNIKYEYNKVSEFYTCYDFSGSQDKNISYEKCSGKYCHVLRNGKISCCPAPLVGHYINKFGANINFDDGIMDIYSVRNTDEIINFLKQPHTACKYCGAPRYFKWKQQDDVVNLNDWMIK